MTPAPADTAAILASNERSPDASVTEIIAGVSSALPSVPADQPLPKEIVWMPKGIHEITAGTLDGAGFSGGVRVDEDAANAVAADFAKAKANGQRVWLDMNHDDGAAVADVRAFSWDPARGIIATVDWTPRGERALRDKEFTTFSPGFSASRSTGKIYGLNQGHAAGGLVNAPAFGVMPALIAARSGGQTHTKTAPGGQPDHQIMKDLLVKILAALKVQHPADATEDTLVALVAKHMPDASKLSEEITAVTAKLDAATQQNIAQVKAKQESDAKIADLEKKFQEQTAVIAGLGTRVAVTQQDPVDVLAAYSAKDPAGFVHTKGMFARERAECSLDRARIFAKDIRPVLAKLGAGNLRAGLAELLTQAELRAKDICRIAAKDARGSVAQVLAANSLGTLSGSLIAQTCLSLIKAKLPALSVFTTDFSNAAAKLNQSVITRVRGIPAVQSYNTGTGYAATAASDTDVSITISAHRYVQIDYNANELASTPRDLFGEQAEGSIYALGKDVVDTALALFTAANFYTTPGSPTGNCGNGGHTVVTSANWGRPAFINARAALVGRHVYPEMDKGFALQNPTYFAQLAQDPSIVSLAVFQDKEIITQGTLPPISGITPLEYADFPANSINLGAVVGTSGAIAIATRLPYDYVDAQIGSNYGAVSQVTDADTGLSVMLVQYVNHDAGVSRYRLALMSGSAVGDSTRAQLITSS